MNKHHTTPAGNNHGHCTMSMCTCTTTCLLYVQVEWSESPLPCNQIFLHVHVYTPCTCLIGYVLHIPRLSLHISFTCIGHTHAALLLSDLQKKNFSCRAQHIPQVFFIFVLSKNISRGSEGNS